MENFTPLPNEWVDQLADGRLTMPMFTILAYLKRTCMWKTGVWRGTAARIEYGLNGELKERQIQRYLKRLATCGYLSSHHIPGVRRSYKIDLNNYVAHYDGEDFLLRPMELKDWQELPKVDDGDDDAQHDGEMTVRRRGDDGQDDAEMTGILDTPDVPDELDGLDEPETPNQPTNQPTNPSEATPPPSLEEIKPFELFTQGILWDFHTAERELDPLEKQAWTKAQIRECWWDYKEPREQDMRLMYESLLILHTKHLLPKEAIAYAKQHFDPKYGGKQKTRGMVIRDCRGLWKAVCGPKVSQTNGLLAQYSECGIKPCEACKFKQGDGSTGAWLNPNLQTYARHPIAPPPPPITTCGECGTKFEVTRAMTGKTCQDCKQKKSDASFLKLLLEKRVTPESDKATYERLVKAGKITDGIKDITQTKKNFVAFRMDSR
jgi:hypothetical protein